MQKESPADVRIARIIAGLLLLQISRIGRNADRNPATACDDFSVGYVFGFVDVMTQRAGIASWDDAYRIFVILAKALFGRETAEIFCERLFDRQHSPEAIWGASTGREIPGRGSGTRRSLRSAGANIIAATRPRAPARRKMAA